jgi:putative endonuclease
MKVNSQPAAYLLASHRNGTLYVGVTSRLIQRLHQHRQDLIEGFTRDYGVHRLVWFEQHETMEAAILREKRIKVWNRAWKIRLIEEHNPGWRAWPWIFALTCCLPEGCVERRVQEMGSRLRGNDNV